MINDARCTVQNNDEWKKNKSKWRQMSKKKLQKKISNTEHTAETLKLPNTADLVPIHKWKQSFIQSDVLSCNVNWLSYMGTDIIIY